MEVAGRRLRRIEGAVLSLAPVPTSAGRNRFPLPARQFFQTTRRLNLRCRNLHREPSRPISTAVATCEPRGVANVCQCSRTADDSADRNAAKFARPFLAPAQRDLVLNSSVQSQLSPCAWRNGCKPLAIAL